MTELRMTIAEPQETVTAKHVQAALEDCSRNNSQLFGWAELDIVPTNCGQVVHMRVGSRDMEGVRQKSHMMVSYILDEGGDVHIVKHALP